MTHYIY